MSAAHLRGPRRTRGGARIRQAVTTAGVMLAVAGGVALAPAARAAEREWAGGTLALGGYVATEARWFPTAALDTTLPAGSLLAGRQEDVTASLVLEPELTWRRAAGKLTLKATPFLRLDSADDERTHADARELHALLEFPAAELLIGWTRVFWGATEAVHWVDVINQSDLVDDPDGETKLGQPMVSAAWFTDAGRFTVFLLPGFRERTYPGAEGRLRVHPRIVAERARYESGAEERHIDWAVRWSRALGDVDLGLSYFHGTTREPTYVPALVPVGPRLPDGTPTAFEIVLDPLYEIVGQVGLDATWSTGSWLWKAEVMHRHGQGAADFTRVAGGLEYTFYGVGGSPIDAGVIVEYLHDSSGPNVLNPFEDDVVLGVRLAGNDLADTTLLAAAVIDASDGATYATLEATRRYGAHVVARLEARAFLGIPPEDFPLNGVRRDHFLEAALEWHF